MPTAWQRISAFLGPRWLPRALNLYPPFLGAGIRVVRASRDLREVDVELRLTALNQNFVGTQFGGSLYMMTDPFYMLMLIHNLGEEYVVWDKAAAIRFLKPGRGRVRASFRIDEERLEEIRAGVAAEGRFEPVFEVEVVGEGAVAVARVEKRLSVRRREGGRGPGR